MGAVILDDDRVLLVKRGQEPLKGTWNLPGGVVELGETLEAALGREVLEETGLRVDVGAVVEVLDRVHTDADGRIEFHYVIVDYLCRARSGALAHGSDAEDARWHPIAGLENSGIAPKAIEVIYKAAELALGFHAK